jgi:MerR family transcriptional regulator, light-induced transcriptional regulator
MDKTWTPGRRGDTAARSHYPIRAVSRLTGIGIDTLRAWERRYGAVTPARDDRGRLYTNADVARLRLLHRAVSSGHSVGRVARLSDEDLRRLDAAHTIPAPPASPAPLSLDPATFNAALGRLDNAAIDRELSRMAAALSPADLVRTVLLPAVRDVGDSWRSHRGGIAHEHVISATLRHLLGSFLRLYSPHDTGPRLLFATPAGDRHEIGILAAAMVAASRGFAVSYVGQDLPAAEILEAVRAAGADVLVLGLTLSRRRQPQERELRTLVRLLPPAVELWTGGPGVNAFRRVLGGRGLALQTFDAYLAHLDSVAGTASRTSAP